MTPRPNLFSRYVAAVAHSLSVVMARQAHSVEDMI